MVFVGMKSVERREGLSIFYRIFTYCTALNFYILHIFKYISKSKEDRRNSKMEYNQIG